MRDSATRDQPMIEYVMPRYSELPKRSDEKSAFNLKADNHEIILTSQTYAAKRHTMDGIASARNNSCADAH
jgi:uncharacterized protein YegP (UPF0339 family)